MYSVKRQSTEMLNDSERYVIVPVVLANTVLFVIVTNSKGYPAKQDVTSPEDQKGRRDLKKPKKLALNSRRFLVETNGDRALSREFGVAGFQKKLFTVEKTDEDIYKPLNVCH